MALCAGCESPIRERFLLQVEDRAWHAGCVRCCDCRTPLAERCFARDGRLFCRNDFYRRFGPKCGGCSEGIGPTDLVRKAKGRVFHLACFTCLLCGRQPATGEEFYVLDDTRFVCKEDFLASGQASNETDEGGEEGSRAEEASPETRRRGPRTTIKAKQLETLKAAFAAAPKPSRHVRERLAHETGLNMRVIQVWFQNRRSKERRMKQLGSLGVRRHPFFRRTPEERPHFFSAGSRSPTEANYSPGFYDYFTSPEQVGQC